jgi:hypothetical protein
MATANYIKTGNLISLINDVDPKNQMYIEILNDTDLGLGVSPLNYTAVIDLAKEEITWLNDGAGEIRPNITPAPTEAARISRRTGEYWIEIDGKRTTSRSLKDLLADGLKRIEGVKPGSLEKLSALKPRSRRIVAHDPKDLFDSQHLARDFAEPLMNGWFYGTNNSGAETRSWLRRAAECAGLKWGMDVKTSLTPTVDDL